MTVALWHVGDGGTRELGFAGGQLAMVRERDKAGAQRYEVRYSDYRDAGGTNFPHKLEADFPASRHVTLRYEAPVAQSHARARFDLRAVAGAGHRSRSRSTLAQAPAPGTSG